MMVGSALVFSRYVAVGGLVAFSVTRDGDDHRVRFEVGGPGVFHNVTVQLFGADGPASPVPRHTMAAGDTPIEWTFALPDAAQAWAMVTWVRPYLQGVESEALAQRLGAGGSMSGGGTPRPAGTCGRSSGSSPGGGHGSRCASCRYTGGGGALIEQRGRPSGSGATAPPRVSRTPAGAPAHRLMSQSAASSA